MTHDDHLASALEQLRRPLTTAEVSSKADDVIREFEAFRITVRRQITQTATVAGIALGTGGVAVIAWLVTR